MFRRRERGVDEVYPARSPIEEVARAGSWTEASLRRHRGWRVRRGDEERERRRVSGDEETRSGPRGPGEAEARRRRGDDDNERGRQAARETEIRERRQNGEIEEARERCLSLPSEQVIRADRSVN